MKVYSLHKKNMAKKYIRLVKITMLFAAFVCGTDALAETRRPPADNDETYKLPMYVPKAALPKNSQKVVFQNEVSDNDEMYVMPKRAVAKPAATQTAASPSAAAASVSSAAPAAGANDAQAVYQRQYEEYQRQMKVYNEQMAQYQRQMEAQRQAQQQQQSQGYPADNDSAYVLPGQYSPVKNRPAAPPAAQTQPQQQPQQAQPQYQPPQQAQQYQQPQPAQQKPISAQYHQQYNYSDDYGKQQKKDSGGAAFPNYYY